MMMMMSRLLIWGQQHHKLAAKWWPWLSTTFSQVSTPSWGWSWWKGWWSQGGKCRKEENCRNSCWSLFSPNCILAFTSLMNQNVSFLPFQTTLWKVHSNILRAHNIGYWWKGWKPERGNVKRVGLNCLWSISAFLPKTSTFWAILIQQARKLQATLVRDYHRPSQLLTDRCEE